MVFWAEKVSFFSVFSTTFTIGPWLPLNLCTPLACTDVVAEGESGGNASGEADEAAVARDSFKSGIILLKK